MRTGIGALHFYGYERSAGRKCVPSRSELVPVVQHAHPLICSFDLRTICSENMVHACVA